MCFLRTRLYVDMCMRTHVHVHVHVHVHKGCVFSEPAFLKRRAPKHLFSFPFRLFGPFFPSPLSFYPFGSHDAPVRRPLEMARPRRRCCSCSWRPRNDRVHPYHTLFALLFALFPFPPLLFSLFLVSKPRTGPEPSCSSTSYVFAQNVTKLNPAPSPSGHPLQRSDPTTIFTDITPSQIPCIEV